MRSAGILLFRRKGEVIEVLLVHPGGPFWRKKDAGAWSIPKGEYSEEEDALETARREFQEELGTVLEGKPLPLSSVRQKGGKEVRAWAVEGELDPECIRSNTFRMEWPPRSGTIQEFPEVDRAAWFGVDAAREKINPAQAAFIEELVAILRGSPGVPHA